MQTHKIEKTNKKEIWIWTPTRRTMSDSISRILSLPLTGADTRISP